MLYASSTFLIFIIIFISHSLYLINYESLSIFLLSIYLLTCLLLFPSVPPIDEIPFYIIKDLLPPLHIIPLPTISPHSLLLTSTLLHVNLLPTPPFPIPIPISVMDLRNPSLKERHWAQINALTGVDIQGSPEFTLSDLISKGMTHYHEEINFISSSAQQESVLVRHTDRQTDRQTDTQTDR